MGGGTARIAPEPSPTDASASGAASAGTAASSSLEPGSLLDARYRIQALIGTGGMGSVYRAEHEAIGRRVAVKVLHPEHCASAGERERFRREARVAVRLRSPHVVEILDFGEDAEGRLFLVMELLEGEPLAAVLARDGRLAPERVVRLLRQLLSGLGAAHDAGIVHRDLKPENLWLSGAGPAERLRLLDFGIAKWTGPADAAATQVGLVVGTPEYLAPEQAVGGEVDHRADLYSAGILAFVLLTGRHPFDTRDVRGLLAAHAYRPVPCPASLVPELSAYPRLLEVVARATEKDRARRPASAAELVRLLERADVPLRLQAPAGAPAASPAPRVAARASLLGIPAALTPDARNLTLVRVQIAGWSSWARATGPGFRARHLSAHDALVLPLVARFGGRRLAAEDGGSTFAFASPTDAVHCAAAIQDRASSAAEHAPEVERLELVSAVHQGEVRIAKGRASGAPIEAVKQLAADAAVGDVWLTRPVHLTMNRSEAPAQERPARALPGLCEAAVTYQLVRGPPPLPYGGRHAGPVRPRSGARSRLEPLATAVASIAVARDAEGTLRAAARVVGAALALLALGAVEAGAGGLHALLHGPWRHARGRVRHTLGGALGGLEWVRRCAARRTPWLSLALRRPLPRRPRPAAPKPKEA